VRQHLTSKMRPRRRGVPAAKEFADHAADAPESVLKKKIRSASTLANRPHLIDRKQTATRFLYGPRKGPCRRIRLGRAHGEKGKTPEHSLGKVRGKEKMGQSGLGSTPTNWKTASRRRERGRGRSDGLRRGKKGGEKTALARSPGMRKTGPVKADPSPRGK